MNRAYEIRQVFQEYLDLPDPRHALLLIGAHRAASYFNSLSAPDQQLLVDFLEREIDSPENIKNSQLQKLIIMAKISKNPAFHSLLDKLKNIRPALFEHIQ